MTYRLLLTLFALSIAITGCQKPSESSTDSKSEQPVINEKTEETQSTLPADAPFYSAAAITSFEPYMLQDEYGKSTGFQIDLLKAVGEEAGFGVNFSILEWKDIFNSIAEDEKDIIAAVIIKEDRESFLDFSEPTIDSVLAVATKKELANKTFQDIITDKTLKFAVINGSRSYDLLIESGIPKENISASSVQFESIKSIITNQVDVVLEDKYVLKYYFQAFAKETADLGIIADTKTVTDMSFAVKDGNKELLDKINQGLKAVKDNGKYDKIYAKWFGQSPSQP